MHFMYYILLTMKISCLIMLSVTFRTATEENLKRNGNEPKPLVSDF